jgi:ABC-type transport system substrate-binding protein
VTRLIFALNPTGVETNRSWASGGGITPNPFQETLIDPHPKTGDYVPFLADKWEVSPDSKTWTFFLHRGVPFHFGFGEFTARDVVHTHSLITREDSVAGPAGFWRGAEKLEVVNDYQIVFHMKNQAVDTPYLASRLRMESKAQWDKEGVEGIDRKPAGTGSYQYVERRLGQGILFERVENHWRGERPDFKELEIRWVPDVATRLAMLLAGEAHVTDLPRGLQDQPLKKGMKIIESQIAPSGLLLLIGGQYHIKGDLKFKPELPWNDKRVRQAMNLAINRKELLEVFLKGRGTPIYAQNYHPVFHRQTGYNPDWEKRFGELYGYNPVKARALLEQAGYAPGAIKITGLAAPHASLPEFPEVMEAVQIYFREVGIQMDLENTEFARVNQQRRTKELHCCISPGGAELSTIEERIRQWNTSKGTIHSFEDDFNEEKHLALTKAVDPKERDRLAREIGDHLFDSFSSIPLYWISLEVVVNPKVVADWTFPGTAQGYWSHWALLKAAN